jgi:hypothetical protein
MGRARLGVEWLAPAPSVLHRCGRTGQEGLYRLRADGYPVLVYVGQTGRALRERLRALRGVYAGEMPLAVGRPPAAQLIG